MDGLNRELVSLSAQITAFENKIKTVENSSNSSDVIRLIQKFDEIKDDDGFACDNIELIENWMTDTLLSILKTGKYHLAAVNFATYGASLMYLNEAKKRLTPVYNYLKPMPQGVLDGFYDNYGGISEFSRITASPALDMLNSGLQILWMKKIKPDLYKQVKHILHFPQYLSLLFTGEVASEYTSIGCHTAMWNFDKQAYHLYYFIKGAATIISDIDDNSFYIFGF